MMKKIITTCTECPMYFKTGETEYCMALAVNTMKNSVSLCIVPNINFKNGYD
jgi:hypothetical protein